MDRDPIKSGSEGRLRAQFLDAAGDPIEADSVEVNLFEPGLNPDTDTPTVAGLIPTYLGEGVYELTITASAPEGAWCDQWSVVILGSPTVANLTFNVIASGQVVIYPINGLRENTLVEITLSKDIANTDGDTLLEDITTFFTTTYTPLYSSVRKIRLDAGGILGNIPDDTINLAILEASLEADVMNFRKCFANEDLFIHARRQYVTCLAALALGQNVLANGGVLKSKMLADFQVTYDVNSLSDLMNRLRDCIDKWETQVIAGGGALAARAPQMVIKGEWDPDRPHVGRGWHSMRQGEIPIGNRKYRNSGQRRWKTGFIKRGGGGW